MKDNQEIFNPNSNPPKVLSGADIIKTVRMAREKPKEKPKKRSKWRPEIGAYKTEIAHGAHRVRNWFLELKWAFPWQRKK